ncbi:MAG: peptide ABC transporter substrate-binding protein [Terrisporobacter othiniensis]|uniref:Peptide ABC transporter substrate-binding protein n=1 Tax=Terrisporobacter hibernicus TaxID=2813371 RepID=A0AAX2ZJF2_9FIRM|nr:MULTISPECIES: peptide ABC transporter substrate-binding protein [Terrisporobacter]MDU4860420.1 peptide ABC transporter substrate-binding protein [Terrisporobacter othiniensis]MDU6993351.1 peptide ABC transporter substrate-binding protein [Terrisporobacter othiniensis]UEL48507.1 peptide ABC transporter substrate-binding protein [Terrisporobacter hibernicus]
MKFKKKIAVLLASALAMSTALAGCSNSGSGGSSKGVELNVNVGPEPATIDPAKNSAVDGATLINHAFEGLMKLDKDNKIVEGQAAKYEVNKDETVYTFTLREGIKWSDGEQVKAEDFVYAWQRLVDPKTGADYNYMIDMVKNANEIMAGKKKPKELGIKALDEKTVEVTLTTPTPYFLEVCAFPATFPVRKDIVEANADTWSTDPKTYIGNGPYVLKSWEHQSKMTYVKNENYYDLKKLGPDTINFVLMEDKNTMLSAYKNNEILFADDLPSEEIDAMKDKGLVIEKQLGTYFLSINVKKEGLDNVKVREALSLALDRDYIVEKVAKGGQIPADSFVATGLTDADGKTEFHENAKKWYDAKDYKGNVEKAKKLLKEAGYENGKGLPSIELMCNPGHEPIMEAVQNMWKENLGVNVTISSQDWNVFLETRKQGDFQVARDGWLGDYNDPVSFIDIWVTGGGNNNAQWSNKEYDKIVSEIKSTTDSKERYAKMHEAEDILAKDMPIIPIYFYTDLYLISDKLEGMYTSPLGYKYFMYCTVTE